MVCLKLLTFQHVHLFKAVLPHMMTSVHSGMLTWWLLMCYEQG